jgi:thymidylate synthase (FAD)
MTKVKLIWVTPDAENLLTYIARVSNPVNQQKQLESENPEQMNSRLIGYLIKHKHWSPFEQVNACFEINTTRAISAQILRHKSFAFQEFSQRYATVDKLSEFHYPEIRYAGTTNRQASLTAVEANKEDRVEFDEYIMESAVNFALDSYKSLISNGVAPESARMILPMCSPTRLYMNGTLRSWIHYLQVRNDSAHTQKEHVEIAKEIDTQLAELFPLTWKALNN